MPPFLSAIAAQLPVLVPAAAAGGLLAWVGFPAAWLSGGMLISAVMAGAGRGAPMGPRLREVAMVLSGTTMGTAVTPETLSILAAVPLSLVILAAAMVAITATSALTLSRAFGWRRSDALFASIPGAMSTILLIAHERKADIPAVATVQLFRLVMLILVLPPLLGAAAAPPAVSPASVAAGPAVWLLLFAAAVPTSWALHKIRMPAAGLLGSMIGAATLTGSGLVPGGFPEALAALGFLLIGVFIGERFRGIRPRDLGRLMPAAIACFAVGIAVAAVFAEATSLILGISQEAALLAFAPGGLEAMSILAFTLAIDPVYVATHHIARFLMIGVCLPIVARVRPALFGEPPAPEDQRSTGTS